MKKIMAILLTITMLLGLEVRDSESGQRPDRLRNLQGGVLIAYNIEKTETDSTITYEYDEVLIKKAGNIDKIPADANLTESEKQELRDRLE